MAGISDQFRSLQGIRQSSPGDIEVDFGAGPTMLDPGTQVLNLRPGRRGIVPADGPVRWEALNALPRLLTVEWAGPARGIDEAVAAHPGIRFLYWFDAEGACYQVPLSRRNCRGQRVGRQDR